MVSTSDYRPECGDIVWLDFDPQAGHEQGGRRPALVLGPGTYNRRTGLMVCCPMTPKIKGYPFEVAIAGLTPSVVLADQVKNMDWRFRRAKHKGHATLKEVEVVLDKLRDLIDL